MEGAGNLERDHGRVLGKSLLAQRQRFTAADLLPGEIAQAPDGLASQFDLELAPGLSRLQELGEQSAQPAGRVSHKLLVCRSFASCSISRMKEYGLGYELRDGSIFGTEQPPQRLWPADHERRNRGLNNRRRVFCVKGWGMLAAAS